MLHARYGLASGFDHYDDDIHEGRLQGQTYRERAAPEVTARARAWLGDRDAERPFFLWVHYWDPHAPYQAPEPWRSRLPGNPYDAEVAAVDEAIGELLEGLRAGGELEGTLVVVTSDHGEAFGEAGELTHGILLRGATLRVPLVMAGPGLPAGRRVPGVVSGADVVPTVLELLGLEPGRLDGESLLEAVRGGRSVGRVAYSETRLPADEYGWSMLAGARGDRWAWVRAPRPELYDLEADAGETRNLESRHPEVSAELDRRVAAVLADRHPGTERSELDPSQIEALRSLGYLFDARPPPATAANPKDMIAVLQAINTLTNLSELGRHQEVLTQASRLLEQTPRNRELLLLIAHSLDQLGRTEEAITRAREALQMGGSLDLDGTVLAMYLAKAGRVEESAALLETFESAEPDFPGHPFNLGNLLSAQGRHPEAVAAYERAHRLDPQAVHILANLAVHLSRLGEAGDGERALELIDRAIALAAGDDLPSLMKLEICRHLGRTQLGVETARRLQAKSQLHNVTPEALAEAISKLHESSP